MLIRSIQDLLRYVFDAAGNFLSPVFKFGELFTDIHTPAFFNEIANQTLELFSIHVPNRIIYKEVEFIKQRLLTHPSLITVAPNEHIVYRTVVMGADGRIFTLEARFKSGEQYSETRHKSILSKQVKDNAPDIENGSEYIDMAQLKSDFYIETVIRR